jgi:hypothetical protein
MRGGDSVRWWLVAIELDEVLMLVMLVLQLLAGGGYRRSQHVSEPCNKKSLCYKIVSLIEDG